MTPAPTPLRPILRRTLILVGLLVGGSCGPVQATPEFGKRWGAQSCNVCHTVVPKLNQAGLDFLANGYLPDPDLNLERRPTLPMSLWLTLHQDSRLPQKVDNLYFGKAELVAGDALGQSVNYFVEWRALSLEAQADGSLKDRSGRFEDLWVAWRPDPEQRWTLQVGQYRPLVQLDPGRRFSLSTSSLFDTPLPGERSKDPRITSLRAFSAGQRSPGFSLGYQSIQGEQAADGLFHNVNVPFPGEITLPLNTAARTHASFELEGKAKGVVLETFYRQGLSSIGVHSFLGPQGSLVAGVGELQLGDFYLTGGLGLDQREGLPSRIRSSLELEFMPTFADDTWRPGFGLRFEDLTRDGRPAAYIPYFALSAPNDTEWSSLLQIEYRGQASQERFRVDFSLFY